jgi:magnesium-transporting ATPase (P-type)
MATLGSGESKALVFATGIHSAFGQIAHLTQTAADTISPLQTEIIRHLPALGLGAEKPGPDIMKAPPRRRDQRLLGGTRLARA